MSHNDEVFPSAPEADGRPRHSIQDLASELKQLRSGLGVRAPDLIDRLGPGLRLIFEVSPQEDASTVRNRVIDGLARAIAELPSEVGLSLAAALALPPAPADRFLQARMNWLAHELSRHTRTAIRRSEQGFTLLAEKLLTSPSTTVSTYAPGGWYVADFDCVLDLTQDPVRLTERRTVVATQHGLTSLAVMWSVPRRANSSRQVKVQLVSEGTLERQAALSSESVWGGQLRLPHALSLGERHTYELNVSSLDRSDYAPFYTVNPIQRMDRASVRIRFDPAAPPEQIWKLLGVLPQVARETSPTGIPVDLNEAAEAYLEATDLRIGLSYGIAWLPPQ